MVQLSYVVVFPSKTVNDWYLFSIQFLNMNQRSPGTTRTTGFAGLYSLPTWMPAKFARYWVWSQMYKKDEALIVTSHLKSYRF